MGFEAEVLAPGHTKAVFGANTIKETLTDYRDAIRHIVTETRNGMDEGRTIKWVLKLWKRLFSIF